MSQSQPLRIETPNFVSFATSKTINGKLWFVNNMRLEQHKLAYLAKYQEVHGVILYAHVTQGNHIHTMARFPKANRACFYRDFNARVAEGVRDFISAFEKRGPLFERRYSEQAVPTNQDIENYFFYCALQPVRAGLCEHIFDYPGYNSFLDSISSRVRKFKMVNWSAYNEAKRWNKYENKKDHTKVYKLKYSRLPGYEHLSQKEYKQLMLKKLKEHQTKLVQEWKDKGHVFPLRKDLERTVVGSSPKSTKKSSRHSKRPLVLTRNKAAKEAFLDWYFSIYAWYKKAVDRYLAGDLLVEFPPGTYKPPKLCTPIMTI